MKRTFFLFILLTLFTKIIVAQDHPAGITLIHETSKIPLADITVQSEDFSFAELSDENGFVSLKNLPATVKELLIT